METKDLVLLMLMPIILVSLIVYTDKNPVITGAVTAKMEESNIIGTYSIMPSFKAKINYDLDDYNKIKKELDILRSCAQNQDVETCISKINYNSQFSWSLGCDKGAEKVLYDFAEFLQDCFDSEDNNCLCKKDMTITKEEIQAYSPRTNQYSFTIKEDNSRNIIITSDSEELSQIVKTNDISGLMPKRYSLGYSLGRFPEFNLFFYDDIKGEEIKPGFGPTTRIIIFKNNINNPKSFDFVNQEGNDLVYSNGKIAVDKNNNPINPNNLPSCNLKPKNIFKFCVTQNNYNVMAYDNLDGQIKERNPVIKFASYVPDFPPEPIKNIEIYDKPKAEKSVLIKWDKSLEKDVVKYRIYYTESSDALEKTPTEELRKNPKVQVKEIDFSNTPAIQLDSGFRLFDCEFDFKGKKCIYDMSAGTALENDKLYYFKAFGAYVYGISVDDNKKYDFSITAVDKNNNEINNIDLRQKLPIVKNTQSIDDLPPSSERIVALSIPLYDRDSKKVRFNFGEKPENNIDGTPLNDFKDYKVYYIKYTTLATQQEKATEHNKIIDSNIKEAKFLASVNYNQFGQPFFVDLTATNPESNNVYFFIIAATDTSGNPKESEYKPKELGMQLLRLEIP